MLNNGRAAGMAQWWERSSPTSVPRVRFPDPASYVRWVCCRFCRFSTLLREVFLRVLRFSPLPKNQHFQFPIRSWNACAFQTSSFELPSQSRWVNKLHLLLHFFFHIYITVLRFTSLQYQMVFKWNFVFRPRLHLARGIWKRRFHSKNTRDVFQLLAKISVTSRTLLRNIDGWQKAIKTKNDWKFAYFKRLSLHIYARFHPETCRKVRISG